MPAGYFVEWGGQFENLERSQKRLALVVPLTLLLIFVLLWFSLKKLRDVLIIYTGIPLAAVGGVFALWLRGIPFWSAPRSASSPSPASPSSTARSWSRRSGLPRRRPADGRGGDQRRARQRLLPVVATAVVDAAGFLPMALSTGVGAEVQRPLATVVIGGVLTSTLLTLFVLPALYLVLATKPKDRKISPEEL